MKKITAILLLICLAFALCACGSDKNDAQTSAPEVTAEPIPTPVPEG